MNKLLTILAFACALPGFARETPRSPYIPSDPQAEVYLSQTSFEQKLNEQVPPGLTFRDDNGKIVTLGDYFNNGKPVVLALVYYRCPGVCNAVMNGLMLTLKGTSDLELGDDYDVVMVSFDPTETHTTAASKKQTYLEILDREGSEDGWHFLVGEEASITNLTETVGFSYVFMPENGEYAHKSGLLFLTPEGIISRYMPGVDYPIRDFRFNLIATSKGTIGSMAEKLFASCFAFDPKTGIYNPIINTTLMIGCVGIVVLLAIMLFFLIRFDVKKQRQFEPHPAS